MMEKAKYRLIYNKTNAEVEWEEVKPKAQLPPTQEEYKDLLHAFLEKHRDRVQMWFNHWGRRKSVPVYPGPDGRPVWLNREMRRR